eukprot:2815167-Karenia_brevis.AAC.1
MPLMHSRWHRSPHRACEIMPNEAPQVRSGDFLQFHQGVLAVHGQSWRTPTSAVAEHLGMESFNGHAPHLPSHQRVSIMHGRLAH